MLATVHSSTLLGISAVPVEVEVDALRTIFRPGADQGPHEAPLGNRDSQVRETRRRVQVREWFRACLSHDRCSSDPPGKAEDGDRSPHRTGSPAAPFGETLQTLKLS